MIELRVPAAVCCDAPGCRNKQPATLVLTASGGFAAAPRSTTWQIGVAPNGVFVSRCPEHAVPAPVIAPPAEAIPDAAAAPAEAP